MFSMTDVPWSDAVRPAGSADPEAGFTDVEEEWGGRRGGVTVMSAVATRDPAADEPVQAEPLGTLLASLSPRPAMMSATGQPQVWEVRAGGGRAGHQAQVAAWATRLCCQMLA